jgi:hypothetical protein
MSTQQQRRGSPRLHRTALYVAMFSLAPAVAHAAKLDFELGASVMHSDNIGLTETDETSDTVVSPELTFDIEQTGSTLQVLAQGNLRYPHYVRNTFDDEVQGALSGTLNWTILPERISFQVADNLSRQSVNVLNNYVPDNQQQVNVFSAGPTFHARFNEVTSGQLDVLYTNTYAEESSEFQGDRYSAEAQVERRLNSTDQLTVNAGALQTHYDSTGAFYDYTRYDAYLGYASSLASVDIELEAGYSQIKPRNYDGDSSSPLFRSNVEWRVAPRTILSAGFLYEFSDAAQNLIIRRDPTDLPPVDDTLDPGLQIGPQTFRQRRVMLGYYFNGERFTFQLNPYYERIRYLTTSSENQDVRAVSAALDWRLRPGLNLALAAVRQERKYGDIFRDDTNTLVNVSIRRELSRHWTSRAYLQRTERDSSSASQSYIENSVMVTLTYRR